MIFNQSEHELQYGTLEIKDGKKSIVLAITGSKKYQPSVAVTPQGPNANLNSFVAGKASWGSIDIPIPGGATSYDLTKPWAATNTNGEYGEVAADNLRFWPRFEIDSTVTGVYPDSSPYENDSSDTTSARRPSSPTEVPSTYIQTRSALFSTVNPTYDLVIFDKTNGMTWNQLVGGEGAGNTMSIAFWIKWDGAWASDKIIVRFGDTSMATPNYRAIRTGAYAGVFRIEWGTNPDYDNVSINVSTAPWSGTHNEWHHVCFTRNAAAWDGSGSWQPYKIYLDGVLIDQNTYFHHTYTEPEEILKTGGGYIDRAMISQYSSDGIDAHIADLAVWSIELTSEEVSAIYNARSEGISSGARWIGQYWWVNVERSTDIGDVTVQYQAIGANGLRVK